MAGCSTWVFFFGGRCSIFTSPSFRGRCSPLHTHTHKQNSRDFFPRHPFNFWRILPSEISGHHLDVAQNHTPKNGSTKITWKYDQQKYINFVTLAWMITNDWRKICDFCTCPKKTACQISSSQVILDGSQERCSKIGYFTSSKWYTWGPDLVWVAKANCQSPESQWTRGGEAGCEQEVRKQDVIDGTCIGRNWLCFLVKNRPNEMRILSGRNKSLKMISKEQKRNTSPAILVMHSFSAFFMVEWESDILVNNSHLFYHLSFTSDHRNPLVCDVTFLRCRQPRLLAQHRNWQLLQRKRLGRWARLLFWPKALMFFAFEILFGQTPTHKVWAEHVHSWHAASCNTTGWEGGVGAVWGCSTSTFNVTSSSGRDSNWRLSCMSDYRWFEAKSKKWKWNGLRCDGLLGVMDRWSCHEFGKRVCR